MKPPWLITVAIIFLVLVLYLVTPIRHYNPILKGSPGWSKSIEESKFRGVYLYEYQPNVNTLRINDTIEVNVKEVWMENRWLYDSFMNKSNIPSGLRGKSQFCMTVDEANMNAYKQNWNICRIGSENPLAYHKGLLKSGKVPLDVSELPLLVQSLTNEGFSVIDTLFLYKR